jgi:hypothetical protein
MEHIVQFAISIDDQTIAKRIEENAEKAITTNLQDMVTKCMFGQSYYGRLDTTTLSTYSKGILDKWLEEHKDEIIKTAGMYLAEKLVRTKAGKALLESKGE